MPNPFPGMDPYLEGPLWTTVHNNLIEAIARQLAPKVRPKYLALTNQRVIVATPDALEFGYPVSRVPDVGVFDRTSNSGTALASTSSAPLVLDALMPETMEQSYIEIRDVAQHRLVTAIEVLSLSNKRGDGLEEFRKKRRELMDSTCHYVEIDLLRTGERFPVAGTLPSVPYFVFLSRASRRPQLDIWPIPLEGPLPEVNVPLLAGDADVILNLQEALQEIYELYSYDQAVDHRNPPTVALTREQASWAQKYLEPR